MLYVCDVLYAVLYVGVSCIVAVGFAASRGLYMFAIVIYFVLLLCTLTI